MARISSTAVRQGLAKRAQPKQTAQKASGGGTDYASRFQNPSAGTNIARTVKDPSRFLNRGGASADPSAPATRRVDPAQTTVHRGYTKPQVAGAVPQTPGRPGSRFGAWTPRTATPAARPMPSRPMTPAPQVARPFYPQPVPQIARPAPTVPVPAPAPVLAPAPVPAPLTVAQPVPPAEPPEQEIARLQQRIAELMRTPPPVAQTAQPFYPQQVYNPTP